jgi:hypothetical protein
MSDVTETHPSDDRDSRRHVEGGERRGRAACSGGLEIRAGSGYSENRSMLPPKCAVEAIRLAIAFAPLKEGEFGSMNLNPVVAI